LDDVLKLPAVMDVARARALIDDLMSRRGAPLTIDASGVEKASALAIEVLIACRRQWELDEQAMEITDTSTALAETWTGLGLSAEAGAVAGPGDQREGGDR
jgi:chemotaxis protein CheX